MIANVRIMLGFVLQPVASPHPRPRGSLREAGAGIEESLRDRSFPLSRQSLSQRAAGNHHRTCRRGLSLLEVILALAILGGSIAVIGELVRLGSRQAAASRDLTAAQLLCDGKMAEFSTGVLPLQNVSSTPIDMSDPTGEWLYSVITEPIDDQGMIAVQVTVEQNPATNSRPVSFTLMRWMIDPQLEASIEAEQQALQEAALEGDLGSSTSGASGGGTRGGGTPGGGTSGGGGRG